MTFSIEDHRMTTVAEYKVMLAKQIDLLSAMPQDAVMFIETNDQTCPFGGISPPQLRGPMYLTISCGGFDWWVDRESMVNHPPGVLKTVPVTVFVE